MRPAIIKDAISTKIELLCRSFQEGQVTFVLSSSADSRTYLTSADILFLFARAVGFEPTALGFGDRCSTS